MIRALFSLLLLTQLLVLPINVYAEQDRDNVPAGGLDVLVSLNHRVVIPKILYFRVGSETLISKVVFDLASSPTFSPSVGNNNTSNGNNPLGNSNPVAATTNGALVVDLRANSGTVTISYIVDNPSGLSDGAGHFIAFDEIATSTDNAGLPAPVLINAASNTSSIPGNFFGGRVVKQQGNWTYSYLNTTTPLAGTYNGRVTYTASAP